MIYTLTQYLASLHSGFGVFQYLTMRAILGTLTALAVSLILGPWMIRTLKALQVGQAIRDDGPQSHLSKQGTPTMGGTLILVSVLLSALAWSDLRNHYVWVVLIVTLLFGAVGFVDDF